MDQDEIMTVDKFKIYRTMFKIKEPTDVMYERMANKQLIERMEEFSNMINGEKIIWAFKTNFDSPISNIFLTNNGKICYILYHYSQYNTRVSCSIINHNFTIYSECVITIRTLFKNISGSHQTWSIDRGGPIFNDNDFNAIYDNLNEYLNNEKIRNNKLLINLLD